MKICRKCVIEQDYSNFFKRKTNKDGLYNKCKKCCINEQREYRKTKNGKKVGSKYHKSKKGQKTFNKFKETEKYKLNQLKWRKSEKGKEASRKSFKNWISKPENKLKRAIYHLEYCNKRYKEDLMFKLIVNVRHYVNRLISVKKINKNNKTINYLGCSLEELKQHLEKQFKEGMSWENYGKWHIDHIIPLSSAKTEEDLYKLTNYNNLQPLWAKENLTKGKKIT